MSYIGSTPTTQAFTPAVDFFNGNGSTVAFTLSQPVASVAQVQAVISNVPQKPGDAYTVSGNTITFTSAPPSGTQNIYVYYTSPITQVIAPGQGTVDTTALVDGSVTAAKLNSKTGTGAVALASLPSFTTTIGVGGATASASGSGVSFPATQSASSDANTLDDYEEGVFTPTLTRGGASFTYTSQYGYYTKIGQLVFVSGFIQWSANSGGSGAYLVASLPFNVTPATQNYPGGSIHDFSGVTFPGSYVVLEFSRNTATAVPVGMTSGGGSSALLTFAGSGYFYFSGTYQTST